MEQKKLILGYWGITGLGQALRYLLSYLEADWKDEVYTDRDKWFAQDKTGLGIPLPNLPYLIDGDFKLSESSAILRYLPKRFGKTDLLGKTIEDQARVDQILGVMGDIHNAISGGMKEEGWEQKRAEVYGKGKDKLNELEKNVKENYTLGYLTIADFKLADFVYIITSLFPEETKELKNLRSISKTLYELPQVKKYLETGVRTVFPGFIKANLTLPGGK